MKTKMIITSTALLANNLESESNNQNIGGSNENEQTAN